MYILTNLIEVHGHPHHHLPLMMLDLIQLGKRLEKEKRNLKKIRAKRKR